MNAADGSYGPSMRRGATFLFLGMSTLLGGCEERSTHGADPLQGVVELEDHLVGFEVSGRVQSVAVERGDDVDAASVVATIDDSLRRPERDIAEARLQSAEAQLSLLEAGVRSEEIRRLQAELRSLRAQERILVDDDARQRRLHEVGAVGQTAVDRAASQLSALRGRRQALEQQLRAARSGARSQERDAARAQVRAAEATLAAIDVQLERHVQHAEAAGRVVDVHVRTGEMVAPGAPAVTIADITHPFVDLFVPQGELDGIRVGSNARCRVDARDGAFEGRVEHVFPRTEFTPRFLFSEDERPNLVVRVRVRLEDPEASLHSGVPAMCERIRGAAPSVPDEER